MELDDLVERHVASVCTSIDRRRLRHTIGVLHDLVMEAVGEQGLAPAGPLFSRYHRLGAVVTLETGVQLAQPIRPVGVVSANTLPGGPVLRTRFTGDPELASERLKDFERYCLTHGLRAVGPPWECYLVDGRDTPREDEWVTELFLPVRPTRRRHGHMTFGRRRSDRTLIPRNESIGSAVRPYR